MSQLAHRLSAISAEGPQTGTVGKQSMAGPTSTSNWVIPGVLLAGDLPKGPKLTILMDVGVQHFVDLRAAAENYLLGLQLDASVTGSGGGPRYTNFDMQEFISSGNSSATVQAAAFLKGIIASAIGHDELTYIHCSDGHALTTVAVCGILSYVYGISGMKATAVAAQLHGNRQQNDGVHQLLNAHQKAFVRVLAEDQAAISESLPLLRSSSVGSIDPRRSPSRGNSPLQSTGPAFGGTTALSTDALQTAQTHGFAHTHHHEPGHTSLMESPSRTGRFNATTGSGGGVTHINIFSSEAETTPTRRGRAAVPGMTVEAVHKPMTPNKGNSPLQGSSGHHTPHRYSDAHSSGGMRTPQGQRFTPRQDNEYVDPLPQQKVYMERDACHLPFGLTVHGVTIVRVAPRSFAEAAGILPGMLLRAVDGVEFDVDMNFEDATRNKFKVRLTLDASYRDEFLRNGCLSPTKTKQLAQPQQMESRPTTTSTTSSHQLETSVNGLPVCFNPRTESRAIAGPTVNSNWVVRDAVCCGSHPDPRNKYFDKLVNERFTTFVSLTETDKTESYIGAYAEATGQMDLNVMHFPLMDGAAVPQNKVDAFMGFIGDLANVVRSGTEKVYIHCLRGHGRTGMVVAALLAELYNIGGMRAVNLCDALHSCRLDTEDYTSPENQEQRTFIITLMTA